MKIAQVAPLYESVPPQAYGGTERVVHYLTEELVHLGHSVTLYASGDSSTAARLVSPCQRSLRLAPNCVDPLAHHFVLLDMIARDCQQYDVIHFHIDYLHFPLSRNMGLRQLTTLHGRQDLPDLQDLYRRYRDMPLVSISNAQRNPLPHAWWLGTVLHGLPKDMLPFNPEPEGYLAFIGRISPEKRVDRAIALATRLRMPLKIAAKIDKVDREYFDEHVRHLLDNPLIDFIGEIGDREKAQFLGNASALLFPIDWPEPFGLVMIEAMACGTPVVAYCHGSVPEVIDYGVTGYWISDMQQAEVAVEQARLLDRRKVRERFEERFTARRMAEDYLHLYEQVASPLATRKVNISAA